MLLPLQAHFPAGALRRRRRKRQRHGARADERGTPGGGTIPERGHGDQGVLAASGIPRQSFGYRYLCDAVAIVRRNPASLSAITKLLYPEIARINASTPARVERDIRSAIFYAHRHFDLQINGSRPTNREFIQLLTDQALDQPIQI